MKINFLLPHLKPSGGVSVSVAFGHELAERGHQVIAAGENRKFFSRFRANFLGRHPLLPKNSKLKIMAVKEFKDLPDADIFVADSWQSALKLSKISTQGVKFQYLQHDERMHHGNPAQVAAVFRLPLIKLVNATWIQCALKKDFNYDADTLFNAVDCELFNPNKRDRQPNDHDIRVLVLHHDYEWKGTKAGVEIVHNLKKKYPNVKLILFGTRQKKIDYPYDEYYYNCFGEELAKLFANGDIYIGSSINDSRAVLHRWLMASGCATAIYNNVSADDYAFDGETTLVAKINDVDDLSSKVEELIVNPELRKTIAGKALKFVRQLPTWSELTDKLESIFKKAIANKGNKILVTGSKGFIGSRLLTFLTEKGYQVEGMDEEITDIEKLRPHFKNAEFVIHLAAKGSGERTENHPHDFFDTNVRGTLNVIKLCLESGCKLIYTGSIAVGNDYAISKALAEDAVRLYAETGGLRAQTVKLSRIYDDKSEPGHPYISNRYPLSRLLGKIGRILKDNKFSDYRVYRTWSLRLSLYHIKSKGRPLKLIFKKLFRTNHA